MEPWRTAIATSDATNIWIRGHEITELMRGATFADAIVLLHLGRLATPGERRLLDAILIGVADHGAGAPSCAAARLAASGNRQSLSAAIAAGMLTIGDEHGGAGSTCMELIAEGVALATSDADDGRRRGAPPRRAGRGRQASAARASGIASTPRIRGCRRSSRWRRRGDRRRRQSRSCARSRQRRARRIKPLPMNIDGALAAVLHDIGFAPPAGRFIFIVGRVAGLTAEVAEEHARERPMRIKFPVTYDGVPPLSE